MTEALKTGASQAEDRARPADEPVRRQALDTGRSFIVQAPAGSGKTELLIRRLLALLNRADAPEEVVAITFTRKAAAEMRGRVVDALRSATFDRAPSEPHKAETWRLAREVMGRDRDLGWGLLESPNRIRIRTIDALCAEITRRMPLASRFGAQPETTGDADDLYREAALAVLAKLEGVGTEREAESEAVGRLLLHLDNDHGRAEQFLVNLLAKRDQWLRHLPAQPESTAHLRDSLESSLRLIITEAIAAARRVFPRECAAELAAVARFAAEHLPEGSDSPIASCRDMGRSPSETGTEDFSATLARWRGVAKLLLVDSGAWRNQFNKNLGLPAPANAANAAEKRLRAEMKGRAQGLIEALSGDEELRKHLHRLRLLPYARYPDAQWAVIEALLHLLPLAVAELRRVFAERGRVDFAEVALAALEGLGADMPPAAAGDSDPASGERDADDRDPDDRDPGDRDPGDRDANDDGLRIRHLLVDEFQDTSFNQVALLERLTARWKDGDGRTLFLVGDPMQSIYLFREAEVGLYLRARQGGIGHLKLEPLRLSVNFRAGPEIVDWINTSFKAVLPAEENIVAGAVPFAPSLPAPDAQPGSGVEIHALAENGRNENGRDKNNRDKNNKEMEGRAVADLAGQALEDGTTAILVRSRGHLVSILPALRDLGVPYRAIDIDPLAAKPVVQDLMALTQALLHPGDRVAWLAVLRAPWCGLKLSELLALVGDDPDAAVWDLIRQETPGAHPAPPARLKRLTAVLESALADRGREPLRRWVERTWIGLGGPAGIEPKALDDARAFLDLLETLDEDDAAESLPDHLASLYARPEAGSENAVQVMTIHKSKGLEFDTVILPGLGRKTRSDDPALLLWSERVAAESGQDALLLASISQKGEHDECYDYIKGLLQEKARYENGRLIYVAATRARRRLHLLGHAPISGKTVGEQAGDGSQGTPRPNAGSLLAQLWPAVEDDFAATSEAAIPGGESGATKAQPPEAQAPEPVIRRLPDDWGFPAIPPAVNITGATLEGHGTAAPLASDEAPAAIDFSWAGETIRHVGTVVHRALQRMAGMACVESTAGADGPWIAAHLPLFREQLQGLGVPRTELADAVNRVEAALRNTLADEKGRWILAAHAEAQSELPLTALLDGEAVHVILDRTFVDDEGTRWIVDFKAGAHQGGATEAFLDREQERYRPQLERYARVMALRDQRPIRLALYFPLLQGWREWAAGEEGS
ncbi:MAG: UvrD-helicase domain-containing protein [SAR324 cluster bacterium]|nr:UvrD-helicase domain-containing protein [SAR324 cluster bacterium]